MAPLLKASVARGQPLSAAERIEAVARAEATRMVVQNLEDGLGRCKTLVLELAHRA